VAKNPEHKSRISKKKGGESKQTGGWEGQKLEKASEKGGGPRARFGSNWELEKAKANPSIRDQRWWRRKGIKERESTI